MIEIRRDIYLNRLIKRIGNGRAKVITGIRRCGKSHLLFSIFRNYLLSNGIDENHIIAISLDDDENEHLLDRHALGRLTGQVGGKAHEQAQGQNDQADGQKSIHG